MFKRLGRANSKHNSIISGVYILTPLISRQNPNNPRFNKESSNQSQNPYYFNPAQKQKKRKKNSPQIRKKSVIVEIVYRIKENFALIHEAQRAGRDL